MLLLLPALILAVTGWLIPGVRLVATSLTHNTGFKTNGGFVGLANYASLAVPFVHSLGPGLAVTLPVFGCAAVFGSALALTTLGPLLVQRIGRVIMAVLLALFAPAGVAAAYVVRAHLTGLGGAAMISVIAYGPAAIALTAILVSAALRAPERRARGVLAVLGLGLTVMLACGSFAFTVPYLTVRRGPLSTAIWTTALQRFDLGGGAALGVLGSIGPLVLGVVATVIVVQGRLRLVSGAAPRTPDPGATAVPPAAPATGPGPSRAHGRNVPAGVVGLLVGCAILLVTILTWVPVATSLGPLPDGAPPLALVAVRTWLPALGVAVAQLAVAVAAGAGIGWFRPLGRHSMALLYLFAPVLLLGRLLLVAADFTQVQTSGLLNTALALLHPAGWPSAVAIVVAAVTFAGLRERSGPAGPAIAALCGVGGILVVVHAAALAWPLVVTADVSRMPGPALTLVLLSRMDPATMGAAATPSFILPVQALVLAGAVIVCLATRPLALTTGRTAGDQ